MGEYFASIDWVSAIAGAIVGGCLTAVSLLTRQLLQLPMKAIASQYNGIKLLSCLSFGKVFRGTWDVSWKVESRQLPSVNSDQITIYTILDNVAFRTRKTLQDGAQSECVFVGKILDRTLTGRWYDPTQEGMGYYGVFQVRMSGGLRDAEGMWSGWTNDGRIQSNEMTMRRVD